MGADQGRLHPDGLLEQAGAFVESLLLKSNGAEDGTGDCLRFGIGKSQLRLPVSFFQPALLDEQGRLLEGVTRVRTVRLLRCRCDHGGRGGQEEQSCSFEQSAYEQRTHTSTFPPRSLCASGWQPLTPCVLPGPSPGQKAATVGSAPGNLIPRPSSERIREWKSDHGGTTLLLFRIEPPRPPRPLW